MDDKRVRRAYDNCVFCLMVRWLVDHSEKQGELFEQFELLRIDCTELAQQITRLTDKDPSRGATL